MNLNPFHKTAVEKFKDSTFGVIGDRKRRQHFFSVVSIIFLFFAIFIGIFVGLLQSQEIRRQASEGTGKAEIVLVPSTDPLRADTLSTVFVRLNTHGEEIDGIQVVFDLLTDTTDEVFVHVKEGTGLRWAWDKVEGIEGGKKISFAAINYDPYQPFSSNQPVDVAEIVFTAKKTGNVAMVFDTFATKANRHQQLKNVLKPIIIQEYKIASAPTPVPTPSPVVTAKPTATPVSTKGETTVATQAANNTVMALVTITSQTVPTIGGGYGQVATVNSGVCNQTCTSSVQCGTNHLCYEGKCRLSTNLTSINCEDIVQRSKGCNAVCNQTIECKVGLTCFEGNCRDSSNPQSEVCQNDQTVKDSISSLCGSSCGVSEDCGDELSCFDGECRLASNPESPNCSDKEVVIKNLGQGQEDSGSTNNTLEVPDEEESLGLLTQVVIALALTVVIGIVGSIIYSIIRGRNNRMEL